MRPNSRETSEKESVSYASRIASDELKSDSEVKAAEKPKTEKKSTYDKLELLCGTYEPKKKDVKKIVSSNGPVWSQI